MQVSLLYHTENPERAVAAAARLCYAPLGAAELYGEMTERQSEKVLSTIIRSGHHSALEHAAYTFAIEGVSRALTHQLVRHRIASFNQQSQRYVKMNDSSDIVTPPAIANNPEANELFAGAIATAYQAYDQLLKLGFAAEDARYLLPNACGSKIVVTMNMRELLHFFELRCCKRAQWEIRELADRMLLLVKDTAPYVFLDAGAACIRGACPEGAMTCGEPYPRLVRK